MRPFICSICGKRCLSTLIERKTRRFAYSPRVVAKFYESDALGKHFKKLKVVEDIHSLMYEETRREEIRYRGVNYFFVFLAFE
ncbi:AVN_HP_G0045720.mRNA.1.CDS.1 [Saccharomyces cerevisiae]|nr:AVN_HP_G0045720.mRNA.1.CDS.1 [Saccharomyces cerevisiae]CAI6911563.1 AVN_HP_G0045720.mRNA.1.CDS.1 [Saccharomyces cerevisiae]